MVLYLSGKGSIISYCVGAERSILHVWQFPWGWAFPHQGSPGHYWELRTGLKGLGKFPVSRTGREKKSSTYRILLFYPLFVRGADIDIP